MNTYPPTRSPEQAADEYLHDQHTEDLPEFSRSMIRNAYLVGFVTAIMNAEDKANILAQALKEIAQMNGEGTAEYHIAAKAVNDYNNTYAE